MSEIGISRHADLRGLHIFWEELGGQRAEFIFRALALS
jgi:hypothetical protein